MTREAKARLGAVAIQLVQTVGAALFAAGVAWATLQGRVQRAEQQIARCEQTTGALMPVMQDVRERLVRIETKLEAR